jgi:hypothetical protein
LTLLQSFDPRAELLLLVRLRQRRRRQSGTQEEGGGCGGKPAELKTDSHLVLPSLTKQRGLIAPRHL